MIWNCSFLVSVLVMLAAVTCATPNEIALRRASSGGNLRRIQQLISAGTSVNARSYFARRTPLMLATRANQLTAMRLLICFGADVYARDEYGISLLRHAVIHGQAGAVKILLDAGARDNCTLEVATYNRHKHVALLLINAGVSAFQELKYAVRSGNIKRLRFLMCAGADINSHDSSGRTPLHVAVCTDHTPIVRLLLGAKANVDSLQAGNITPLLCAAVHNRCAIAQLLVDAGADVHTVRAFDGRNALLLAARMGYAKLVRILIRGGADPNSRFSKGSVLLEAARNGHVGVVKFLTLAGADVNAREQQMSAINGLACPGMWRPPGASCKRKREKAIVWLMYRGASLPDLCELASTRRSWWEACRFRRHLAKVYGERITAIEDVLDAQNIPRDLWKLILGMVYEEFCPAAT